jgi:hypothetical protein
MIKTIEQAKAVQARREDLRRNMTRRVLTTGEDGVLKSKVVAAHVGEAKSVRRFRKRSGFNHAFIKAVR